MYAAKPLTIIMLQLHLISLSDPVPWHCMRQAMTTMARCTTMMMLSRRTADTDHVALMMIKGRSFYRGMEPLTDQCEGTMVLTLREAVKQES